MKNILLLLFIAYVATEAVYSQSQLTVGILSDFNAEDSAFSNLNHQLIDEVTKVLGQDYNVISNASFNKFCGSDSQLARKQYAELSQSVDIVILVGPHSIKGGVENMPFKKKTFALGVFNPKLQSIPLSKNKTSATSNFNYIASQANLLDELKQFKADVNYNHLGILIDAQTKNTLNASLLNTYINNVKDSINSEVSVHYIDSDNIDSNLNDLPTTMDAVFIGVPFEWNSRTAKAVFAKLNEKQMPSLVMNNQYLNYGGLLSYSENTSLDYILRKLAINILDAMEGSLMSDMSVMIDKNQTTSLNITTAKSINYSPRFETLFTANIIKSNDENDIPKYSIQTIIKKALEENLNISISQKDIELAENDIALAKSQFLPTVDANLTGLQLDKNRPNALIGQAERSLVVGGTAQQLIYSESAIANIAIKKHLLKAQQYATEYEILDQLLTVFNSYFNLLQAKTFLAIQQENLDVTKQNLELAKTRNKIGISNQSDLYRWQSEMASAKQNLVEANTKVLALKYQLNTFLNNTLPEEFDIDDLDLNTDVLNWFQNSGLEEAINTPASLNKLTSFLANESIQNHPAKKQLLANIDATERQKLMNKRLFYTPTIALQGQVNQTLARDGLASTPLPDNEFYNNTWDIGIAITYPIFQGKRRKLNLAQNKIVLNQLDDQSNNISQNLQLQVKINTLNIIASKTNINNSKIALDNAEENFKIIQQNYQLGTINITQLIDAQRNLFSLRQSYSVAIYEYLLNFTKLENSVGFYSILATEEEKQAFQNRYITYLKNN